MKKTFHLLLMFVLLPVCPTKSWAYGPFNHLCVVNNNWESIRKQIVPLGNFDEPEAKRAAFAGALLHDLGYYPLSERSLEILTDATHYIRSGDWVQALLQKAKTGKDPVLYAFALGVLSHYASDRMGHYYGTNVVAVAVTNNQKIYGRRMSYERDQRSHFFVESGFDLIAVKSTCTPNAIDNMMKRFLGERELKSAEKLVASLLSGEKCVKWA